MIESKVSKVVVFVVVMLLSFSVYAKSHTVEQRDKTFVIAGAKVETLTIKVGDKVRFKNKDPWFHNIFSLSDISTFDLGSYTKNDSRTYTFDKAGEAEIECAIHPQMYMIINVE